HQGECGGLTGWPRAGAVRGPHGLSAIGRSAGATRVVRHRGECGGHLGAPADEKQLLPGSRGEPWPYGTHATASISTLTPLRGGAASTVVRAVWTRAKCSLH